MALRHVFDVPGWALRSSIAICAVFGLATGCMPPGPRALLEGKRMLDQGNYPQALEHFREATALLTNNAQAWNYLGLAYHYTGQVKPAEQAYQRALNLDHDLSEAHYNLGCLWLEENKFEAAKSELTAYTLRRGNSIDPLLKLGTAQLYCREPLSAEKSFGDVLRLNPQNPSALNGLGLARLQRNRPGDAAEYFKNALKQQPDYRPAMLNLAVVAQQ
jgi:Flp pilus assembly protein TadD